MNPADDTTFTRPLIRALRGHVDALAESMAGAQATHRQLAEVRPAAVTWVYYSVLVAWAEDHQLINPWLRNVTPELRDRVLDREGGPVGWLSAGINSLAAHPATRCLLDPRYSQLRDHTPSGDACRALIDWWDKDAPSLAYDTEDGLASISGFLIGDLLQALSTERVKANAFCQSPVFVADFLIDMTLIPAASEFHGELLRAVDPAAGTGHVLIRVIDYLWEWYTTGTLACRQVKSRPPLTGGRILKPAEAIRRIIAGVDGCELDPLTAAVARLRLVAAIGDLIHRSGLLPILVGDSLLAGKVTKAEYARLHPGLADIDNLGHDDQPTPPAATKPAPVIITAPQQLGLFEAAS